MTTEPQPKNPFDPISSPGPNLAEKLETPPLTPYAEHKRRTISFKVAVAALCVFGACAFAIVMMTLNIYYPTYAPLYFTAIGAITVTSFVIVVVASGRFVMFKLKSINIFKH
jgi:hypothetical protein